MFGAVPPQFWLYKVNKECVWAHMMLRHVGHHCGDQIHQTLNMSGDVGQRSRKVRSTFNLCLTHTAGPRWTPRLGVKDCHPQQPFEWVLESENQASPDSNDGAAAASVWVRDSRNTRGSKMQRYHTIPSPLWPPVWAYSNRTDSHNTVVRLYPPSRGLLQTAQECQDRDPTRSTAGRRIPTILRFVLWLSGLRISVVHVCLGCHPGFVLSYCSSSKARGHSGYDIRAWREMNGKHWPQ